METSLQKGRDFGFFSSAALRLLACITMLMDHVGYLYYYTLPIAPSLRVVGRLSFPIFAFLIAEGYRHTKNVGRYALRLFLLALISEPLLDRCFFGSWYANQAQNALFTLLLGLFAIHGMELFRKSGVGLFSFFAVFFACVCAQYYGLDYGYLGVLMIVGFYLLLKCPQASALWWGIPLLLLLYAFWPFLSYKAFSFWPENWGNYHGVPIFRTILRSSAPSDWDKTKVWALAASLPLLLYNGKSGMPASPRGRKALQFVFYSFYPLHLLALILLTKQ